MRKAFIGLSTPLGYNYKDGFEGLHGKPNPIIDSPMGLFLFYDEIWFINRRTCPLNCENLPYVKFLDEEYDLKKLPLEQFNWELIEIDKNIIFDERENRIDIWAKSLDLNLGNNRNGVDNHGRGFKLGSISVSPNATTLNLMIDDYLASYFGFELITSSITSNLVKYTKANPQDEINRKLTQLLICENIPNFQLREGPYHDFIEDLRSEPLLKKFRSKIIEITTNKSEQDLHNLKNDIEKNMERYLYELILNHIGKEQIFKSTFDAVVGQIPVFGNIYGALDGGMKVYESIKDRNEVGWIGFIAKSKLIIDK